MAPIRRVAPAKINLNLHVLGRMANGYHALESLVVFAEFGDGLAVREAPSLTLAMNGEFADAAGGGQENLVLKAARALQQRAGLTRGAAFTLSKHIPVGAGLGGGSADAAAALRALNQLWELNWPREALHPIARELGADVAMCLASTPAIARGVGDELAPLGPLPPCHVVLVHPRVLLLTEDVYRNINYNLLSNNNNDNLNYHTIQNSFAEMVSLLQQTRNDLQPAAIAVSASVAEVLLALETVLPAPSIVRMTGSGACCFGLYAEAADADKASRALKSAYPDWWVQYTQLQSGGAT